MRLFFRTAFACIVLWSCQAPPASGETITQEQLQRAQLLFEEARVLLSRALLETDQATKLELFERIAGHPEISETTDVIAGPLPDHPSIRDFNSVNRFRLWTRNIHSFARLQVAAPDCFRKLTTRCFLSLLADYAYADPDHRNHRYPRYVDIANRQAINGFADDAFRHLEQLQPIEQATILAKHAGYLLRAGQHRQVAQAQLEQAVILAGLADGAKVCPAWTTISNGFLLAERYGDALDAVKKCLISLEAKFPSKDARRGVAWLAQSVIEEGIGDDDFIFHLLQKAKKALDELSVSDRFVEDRQLSSSIGRFLGRRVATQKPDWSEIERQISMLANQTHTAWEALLTELLRHGRAAGLKEEIERRLRGRERDTVLKSLAHALARRGETPEDLGIIQEIGDTIVKADAISGVFRERIGTQNPLALEDALTHLDMIARPMTARKKVDANGFTFTTWQDANAVSAVVEIRRAEILALGGKPHEGLMAITRSLEWIQAFGRRAEETQTLVTLPRDGGLSPMVSAWIALDGSGGDETQQLFETAMKAGKNFGNQRFRGMHRSNYYRHLAATLLLLGRPNEANHALAEVLFGDENFLDLMFHVVVVADYMEKSVRNYPNVRP